MANKSGCKRVESAGEKHHLPDYHQMRIDHPPLHGLLLHYDKSIDSYANPVSFGIGFIVGAAPATKA